MEDYSKVHLPPHPASNLNLNHTDTSRHCPINGLHTVYMVNGGGKKKKKVEG